METKPINRRDALKRMALATAATVLAACSPAITTKIVESTRARADEPGKDPTPAVELPRAMAQGKNMKILMVYDTLYGNTGKIAEAIKEGVGRQYEVKLIKAVEAKFNKIENVDLLIVGSPTHGGQYSQPIKIFLDNIPDKGLQNIIAAAFDTGSSKENQGSIAKAIIDFFGYASPRIAKELNKKGASIIGSQTFFVLGKEGPLKEGEIEHAKEWANGVMKIVT